MADIKQTQTGSQSQSTAQQSTQGQGGTASRQLARSPSGGAEGLSRTGTLGTLGALGSPFALMRRLTDEMDRMFEDFALGRPMGGLSLQRESIFQPEIEIFQRDNQLVVRADVPGIEKDDVRVELIEDALMIEGERQAEHVSNERGVYRTERSYGQFRRMVPLPSGVNPDSAQVTLKNGVLEVVFDLPEGGRRGRKLEIRDESTPSGSSGRRPTA